MMNAKLFQRATRALPRPGAWNHRATRNLLVSLMGAEAETADEVRERVEGKDGLWRGVAIDDAALMESAGIRRRSTFLAALFEAIRGGYLTVAEWGDEWGVYHVNVSAILKGGAE